jgi:hypothetical protein
MEIPSSIAWEGIDKLHQYGFSFLKSMMRGASRKACEPRPIEVHLRVTRKVGASSPGIRGCLMVTRRVFVTHGLVGGTANYIRGLILQRDLPGLGQL